MNQSATGSGFNQNPQPSQEQSIDEKTLDVMKQKSFIGGVPTDNIIEVLDEEEEVIEKKLRDINVNKEPEKDILNVETDEEN